MLSPRGVHRSRATFRADIEGLHAVAVVSVVLYHAHVAVLHGGYVGVDVFFVISGFLITDLLWRELDRNGRLSLAGFYARRVRRLLPASMLVLIVTMVASARLLPPLQTHSVWRDGLATALYVANYRFAVQQTNYLTVSAASPFQHYWSLGVEEQFYLVWPVLLLLAARAGRRRPGRVRAVAALLAVSGASLVTSLILTRSDEPWAFFSLPTRAWELGVGGLVALAAPYLRRVPPTIAAAVGWLGLAAIVWAVLTLNSSTAFPGTAALWPVLGAAGVVGAGVAAPAWGPVMLLERTLARFLGRISYSLYLWHWPVIILVPYAVGHALDEVEYLGLVGVSVILASATYLFVERPARDWRWLARRPSRSLAMGAVLTACGVSACLIAAGSLPSTAGHGLAPVAAIYPPGSSPTEPGRATNPSARPGPQPASPPTTVDPRVTALDGAQAQVEAAVSASLHTDDVPANLDPPLAEAAASESAPAVDGCLLSYGATSSPPCLFGDATGATSIVLFGDSHATMWFPAVDSYADAQHARLYVWTKATCPPVDLGMFSPVLGREFSECDSWRAATVARIQALKPSLVILGIAPNYNAAYHIAQDGPQWLAGLTGMIGSLRQSGAAVAVIGPVPSPPDVVADCLSAHLSTVQACDVPVQNPTPGAGTVGYDESGLIAEQQAVERADGTFIDVQPWFCGPVSCPVIVDNLLVFRDNSHITVPYADYLAPLLAASLPLASG